ncbi:glyoxalase [Mycolicibacterium sp. CH28]|uniref:VOC family protein n=1 Tax=Mycolicibacterium sp. CH28 TaxID=2512237 RepID=UPI0010814153|nr:VOC family protein [Mycolicibacterium sp. CH28]TGD87550.1 glyoxalase [Mycolicibacterium sp. CH28]
MTETDPPTTVTPVVVRTHLSLLVRDPEASAQWFADVLGMKITARGPQWVFLSFGRKHHDLALIRAEEGAQRGGLGLQHYGLEIAGDVDELRRLYAMLLSKGVEVVKTTDHRVGIGLYFEDPDGNRFEFFSETVTDDAEGRRVLGEHNAPSTPIELTPLYT